MNEPPLVTPADATANVNAGSMLKHLPAMCETVTRAQFDDRAWQIVKKRFLAPPEARETLESIGDFYHITRERVRQIQAKCITALRKPLLEDDYRALEFRFRDAAVRLFNEAREHFEPFSRSSCMVGNSLDF